MFTKSTIPANHATKQGKHNIPLLVNVALLLEDKLTYNRPANLPTSQPANPPANDQANQQANTPANQETHQATN
jgi:hypothetical protein